MIPLSPDDAAVIAQRVYLLKNASIGELKASGGNLGCEGQFKVQDNSRFSGRSGILTFHQLTGFGYICEGEGIHQGEILVATRGTKTGFDLVTDFHTGVRRGPTGTLVHIGFQQVWESYAEELKAFLRGRNPTHIHCVGHSLGGALATLNADYFTANKLPFSLYTFGCPRVGPWSFSQELTRGVGAANIYRVSHTTDPVAMVPSFPFVHAPYEGKHYTIVRDGLVWIDAHFMGGYSRSVAGKSWSSLVNTQVVLDWSDAVAKAWLEAVKGGGGGIMMYVGASLDMIAQALRWIIRKAAAAGLIVACNGLGGAMTAADLLVTLLNKTAELSKEMAEDIKTVMSAILRFLGRNAVKIGDVTQQFIRWIFDQLYGAISSMANRAMMGDGKSE